MTKIYLMRHGHTENPDQLFYGPEFPLSEAGRQSIAELAQDMAGAGIGISRIIASPFRRTQETAQIAASAFGVASVETDDRLREWDVNGWFDKPLSDFYAATHYSETPPRVDDPQVEPLERMAQRIVAVLEEVAGADSGSILLVSHREPLVSALLHLRRASWDGIHQVSFPPGSVWEVEFDGKKFHEARKKFDRHIASD
jgi:broad specificity phosphatase PhoE